VFVLTFFAAARVVHGLTFTVIIGGLLYNFIYHRTLDSPFLDATLSVFVYFATLTELIKLALEVLRDSRIRIAVAKFLDRWLFGYVSFSRCFSIVFSLLLRSTFSVLKQFIIDHALPVFFLVIFMCLVHSTPPSYPLRRYNSPLERFMRHYVGPFIDKVARWVSVAVQNVRCSQIVFLCVSVLRSAHSALELEMPYPVFFSDSSCFCLV